MAGHWRKGARRSPSHVKSASSHALQARGGHHHAHDGPADTLVMPSERLSSAREPLQACPLAPSPQNMSTFGRYQPTVHVFFVTVGHVKADIYDS